MMKPGTFSQAAKRLHSYVRQFDPVIELSKAFEHAAELETHVARLEEQKTTLEANTTAARDELETLRGNVQKFKQDRAAAEAKLAEIASQAEAADKARDDATAAVTTALAELRDLQAQRDEEAKALAAIRDEVGAEVEKREAVRKEVAEAEIRLAGIRSEMARLAERITA